MELGVYSFGDTPRDPRTGQFGSTADAMRNLLEAIRLADEVGLDYFGVGEHHTVEMPASAAAVVLAAAPVTKRITLASAVTVLSTEDPVRVYQQFATLDAVSNGRAEITAGRGSSTESFPLFGYSLNDYDELYAEKLDLLLAINGSGPVTWKGKYRPSLDQAVIVPRPDRGRLPIWLGTGGNPHSSVRAGLLGLPISYGIIGGQAARFAALAGLYRRAAREAGVPEAEIRISVASPGFVGDDAAAAKDLWFGHFHEMMASVGRVRGFDPPPRSYYDRDANGGGALFVGDPEEVAERIVALHRHLGHMRQFFQMDIGHLPQRDFLRAIELLGTRVKPIVDKELATVKRQETVNADQETVDA
jgi:probable LLM family oxidoreductase